MLAIFLMDTKRFITIDYACLHNNLNTFVVGVIAPFDRFFALFNLNKPYLLYIKLKNV
jgi:hypothetical protein